MSEKFSSNSPLGKELAEWWRKLKDDTASRAELRRCDSVAEVVMTPAFQRLCHQLKHHFTNNNDWQDRLAAIVGLASHLKHDLASSVLASGGKRVEKLAEQMAQPSGERPVVSELRFRRLLQRERDDLYAPMIRILRMVKGDTNVKGGANLYGLAESIFYWGNDIKKRWAYAYFPKVPAKKSA